MKFKLVEHFDDLLLEGRNPAIDPDSKEGKEIIAKIEDPSNSITSIAKEYNLSRDAIYTFIKNSNLQLRNISTPKPSIEPGSEKEKEIIAKIEDPANYSLSEIGRQCGVDHHTVSRIAKRNNLRPEYFNKFHDVKEQKFHVYFNTLAAHVNDVDIDSIRATMNYFPSIYLDEYSMGTVQTMYEYIRDKYLEGKVTNQSIIEFYLKIASKEISLDNLITEMKAQSGKPHSYRRSNFDYKFITVSTEELSTLEEFNSDNRYPLLATDILTHLGRKHSSANDFDSRYEDLKAVASKIDPDTAELIDSINTYIDKNIEEIAQNIYSNKGEIIEPTNYININGHKIPYERSFTIQSLQNVASLMDNYKGYLLYGFMNTSGAIVYIGISIDAEQRGDYYKDEKRSLICRAFDENKIEKLIVFKSNLPVNNKSLNTSLIYALESYFAKDLFKTHPAKYPDALNQQEPGQNSSRFLASQRRNNLEIYIRKQTKQKKLLSSEEYFSAVRKITGTNGKHYPYYLYAKQYIKYISEHNLELSYDNKEILYRSLPPQHNSIFWTVCSSEEEFKKITQIDHIGPNEKHMINNWKNYRIKNNLPIITEDLDDDIDIEYFI